MLNLELKNLGQPLSIWPGFGIQTTSPYKLGWDFSSQMFSLFCCMETKHGFWIQMYSQIANIFQWMFQENTQDFLASKISKTELLERSNMSDIGLTVKWRKWRWLWSTLRKGQIDVTNQSLRWDPQGNRGVGGLRSTWRRELQNNFKGEINKYHKTVIKIVCCKFLLL